MALTLETKLDAAALRETHALFARVIAEVDRACGKHPLFPDRLTSYGADDLATGLKLLRHANDDRTVDCATAHTVIDEEVLEFMEAASIRRDTAAARGELVQVIAMLIRTWLHIDDYIKEVAHEQA